MSEFSKISLSKEDVEPRSLAARIPKPKWLTRKVLADMALLYDIAAIIFSAWISYYLYLINYLDTTVDINGYLFIVLVVTAIFYMVARQRGFYDHLMDFRFASQMSTLFYVCALTLASAFGVVFFLKIHTEFSRVWVLLWMGTLLVTLAFGRILLAGYADMLARNGILRRSVVLIGAGNQFSVARARLAEETNHFSLVNTMELDMVEDTSSPFDGARLTEELSPFIKEAQEKHIDGVVIALPSSMGLELEKIMQQVQMLPVDVQVFPDFGGVKVNARHIQKIGDAAVITTVSKPISEWGIVLKTIEDYVLGTICLLLALPVMAVVAVAIKLDSEGPVFFRQRRHGYNHRVIEVLKFRTMRVLEDGDNVKQATKNDSRITRVGAFLRRTSLDELPQFWNVIRGEMSVVGPRPHAIAHNTYYGKLIEKYANRHRVKPGITGWAQVHGFRGETTEPSMMEKRVGYDLEYIENWSLWLDLKIFLMTPLFGLFRRSAY